MPPLGSHHSEDTRRRIAESARESQREKWANPSPKRLETLRTAKIGQIAKLRSRTLEAEADLASIEERLREAIAAEREELLHQISHGQELAQSLDGGRGTVADDG